MWFCKGRQQGWLDFDVGEGAIEVFIHFLIFFNFVPVLFHFCLCGKNLFLWVVLRGRGLDLSPG